MSRASPLRQRGTATAASICTPRLRYRVGGLAAVEPRSRRRAAHHRLAPRARGPHRFIEFDDPRILHHAGLIVPEPRTRPRSSYRRFTAEQPNECWQSDVTHRRLADGCGVEILNWLDDHSRLLLSCTVHTPVTGEHVVTSFADTVNYGLPPRP